MKFRLLVASLLLTFISLPGLRAGEETAAAEAQRPETELERTMTKMGRAWRQIRKANREGQLSPACAEYVATIRANAEIASTLTPALETEQLAGDRAKFHADYETKMKKLIETLTALESALKASDISRASTLIGEVGELMKSGHHDFKKPDEHAAMRP
jgi:hypothetical protein